MADEENPLDRPVIIFGRDIRKIPCFKDSLLYGIGSGLGGALVVFMFTSKPRVAANCMMGTFGTVTLTYWLYCRKRWAHEKFTMGQIRSAMKGVLVMDDVEQPDKKKTDKVEIVDV